MLLIPQVPAPQESSPMIHNGAGLSHQVPSHPKSQRHSSWLMKSKAPRGVSVGVNATKCYSREKSSSQTFARIPAEAKSAQRLTICFVASQSLPSVLAFAGRHSDSISKPDSTLAIGFTFCQANTGIVLAQSTTVALRTCASEASVCFCAAAAVIHARIY